MARLIDGEIHKIQAVYQDKVETFLVDAGDVEEAIGLVFKSIANRGDYDGTSIRIVSSSTVATDQ